MNILALGSHPDDIELGCGGTLIKYAREGHHIYVMLLTDGAHGGDAKVRREEQAQSARIMGIHKVIWAGYRDTEIFLERTLIKKIEEMVRTIEPVFFFVNHTEDTHQDHRNLARCAVSATRYTRNVLF